MENKFETIVRCLDELPKLQDAIKNKVIVLYLGLTRSGKSTLVNYIIGTKLKAIRGKNRCIIEKVDDSCYGPEISHGAVSSTIFPHSYSKDDDFVIVDTAGFLDNRGEVQEIRNALFLKQMQYAKSCKFVLVVDINEIIHDNIQLFIMSLTKLVNLVDTDLTTSLSFIFTKSTHDYDRQDLIMIFREQIIEKADLSIDDKVRRLLEHIVKRPVSISFFRMPRQDGLIINDQLLVDHYEALRATDPLDMQNIEINFCISEKSQNFISSLYREIIRSITFSNLFDFYMTLLDYSLVKDVYSSQSTDFVLEKYVYASTDEELDRAKLQAITLKGKLLVEIQIDFQRIRNVLNSVSELCNLNTTNIFFQEMSALANLDEIVNMDLMITNYLFKNHRIWMSDLQTKIHTLLEKIDSEQNYRSNIHFVLNLQAGISGVGLTTGLISGIGLRIAAIEAVQALLPAVTTAAIPIVGWITAGTGLIVGGVTFGLSVYTYVKKKNEYISRIEERKKQCRHVSIINT